MRHAFLIAMILPLAACAGGLGGNGGGGLDRGESDAALSGIEAVEANTAVAEASEGQFVGFSVTSLGDATRPGLWLETPLVEAEGPGRVVSESGQTLGVTLRPTGGASGSGSRMSIEAFQALGIPLTNLPTLTVISDA